MKKLLFILLLVGVAIYFKLFTAEQVMTGAGKVIDTTINVVGGVAEAVGDNIKK